MAAIEKRAERPGSATLPPTGLLLSIGDITTSRGGKEIPTRIDHFRPKEGQLEQYAAAAAKFGEVYGEDAKVLDDVYFLSNNLADVLDIRVMAWGTSGPRIAGDTNYAGFGRDEWEQRAFAFDDEITYYPLSADEVKLDIRAGWNGEPIRGLLEGRDDARIEKLKINVECTLTFCLPKVMGFGTVAKITTKSKRSMRNLMSSVLDQSAFFQGQLVGIPFRLAVRPAKSRRFDKEHRRYVPFEFYELVLDTPFTVQEAIDTIRERRVALGGSVLALPAGEERAVESRAIAASLEPSPVDETQQLRDEPAPDRPGDARLNRLARLVEQVGTDAVRALLIGVFGVESAGDLTEADAEKYEAMLARNAETDVEDLTGQGEVVDGESDFERMAREAQERGTDGAA